MMFVRCLRFAVGVVLGIGWVLGSVATAAPPTLTYLYPAGVQAGTTADITAGGTFAAWPTQFLTDDPGLVVTPGKTKGQIQLQAAPQTPPGWHWLRAVSAEGVSNPRIVYVGTLPELLEKEPNDSATTAPTVTVPTVMNGKLNKAGDVDSFAVLLKKGQTLVANLEANRHLQSPMDAILQIVSADGFVLQHDHDTVELDPRIVFTAPADGRYLVRVFAFPSQPNSSIQFMGADTYIYRLTLTTGAFADHPWPLAVSQGTNASVRLIGPNISPNAPLVAVPNRGVDRLFDTVSSESNTVAVWREPYPCFTTDQPTTLTPPFAISGRLPQNGAVQSIAFTAKKGQRLAIKSFSRAFGQATMPVLRVVDASGTQLVRVEPTKPESDTETAFVAKADGTYRVEVRDLFDHGSSRHVFLLRVTTAVPDFTLTTANDRITITPGKPTDVAVTITAEGGFKDNVNVTVEGLPKGVTAAPTGTPAKKGATTTVTLRFQAQEPVAAQRIRIVGISAGAQPLQRTATIAVPELPIPVQECWLTVLQPPSAKAPAAQPAPPKKKP
ncbi:MAG: PPC domain-containing protein [Bacteroidales bacterium]|nr:PPC domain-containing protein [Bacteroidales bacterium]